MKFKKLTLIIIMVIIITTILPVEKMSFAQAEVVGSYFKSKKEVLFNPGRGSTYLSAYEIEGKEGTFICIDDLEALNFTKRWDTKKRQTAFNLKVDGMLDFKVNLKILKRNKDYLQKNKNLYKSDIKILVNDKQLESYNADGYSLVSVESLKGIGLDNFFIWDDSMLVSRGKFYPMISDFGVGLVDIYGNIILKPSYDSIDFFNGNNDRYLVKKNERYMIINSKNQVIADLLSYNFSPNSYYDTTENGLISIKDYDNQNMEILNSNGYSVLSNKYKDFYFVGDKYVVCQNFDGSRHVFLIENESLTPFAVIKKPERDYYRISDIFGEMIIESTDYGSPTNIYDLKGEAIQTPKYLSIYSFNGDYKVAWLPNKRFTFVNRELNKVTNLDFKDVSKVKNGLFIFLKDIEYSGSISSATGLEGALFGIGSIDKGVVVPAEYKKLKIYNNNLIRFSKKGKLYGVMDKSETIILKEEFDSLQIIEDKIYALKGENLFTYSINGTLEKQEKFFKQIELRDSVKNYGQFESDTKHCNYPKDLPTGVWDDYREGLFTQGDIDSFDERSYNNPETHYGFSTVKYMITKKGVRIPYCITRRGMPIPPPDNFFPTYLEK